MDKDCRPTQNSGGVITEEAFETFLKCPTKSYLRGIDAIGAQSEFGEWQERQLAHFKQTAWERFQSSVARDELFVGTPPPHVLKERRYRVILDYVVDLPEIRSRLHALERSASARDTVHSTYIPVRFVPTDKLTVFDKLLLAFGALALFRASGKMPHVGKIIHGRQHATVRVPLTELIGEVRLVLSRITAQQGGDTPPPLVLNKHCLECAFQSRCRQISVERDDLSLLANMTVKERKKLHDKGIFTVTQLSYTFRPRRHFTPPVMKQQHALKALAIRKKQIHIFGTPTLSAPGTPVYFDVEGDPDRDFYYLIGLRTSSADSFLHYSFWANDLSDERDMWTECLRRLGAIDNPRLIHYGSYETQFLKRMKTRYPNIGNPVFLEQLGKSALNLLSVIYAHAYFPTYSNSLKEVARYLGFRWSDNTSSGLTALVWRSQWESSREPGLKRKLVTYNAEDCEALQKVTLAVSAFCQAASSEGQPMAEVVNVDSLKREYPQRFGEVEFLLPEFQRINEASYWDYQRNRVYVRSNQRLRRLSRETFKRHSTRAQVRPNKVITIEEPRPVSCCHCNDAMIYRFCARIRK